MGGTCEARPSPAAHSLPQAQALVENGTFSTGPLVRNRREPRPGRPCEAPPTQVACQRGVRGPARRMESSPAPGSLWFLSPAGKELVRPQTHETPSSNIPNPVRVPPIPPPLPFHLKYVIIPSYRIKCLNQALCSDGVDKERRELHDSGIIGPRGSR